MLVNVSIKKFAYIALISLFAIGLNIPVTHAEEDVTDVAAAQVNPKYTQYKENFSVKRLFIF